MVGVVSLVLLTMMSTSTQLITSLNTPLCYRRSKSKSYKFNRKKKIKNVFACLLAFNHATEDLVHAYQLLVVTNTLDCGL